MNDKYYKKLGSKITEYVELKKFTSTELGKIFEQYYEIFKNEEMRDLREVANKK
jgi:hypothetical protein